MKMFSAGWMFVLVACAGLALPVHAQTLVTAPVAAPAPSTGDGFSGSSTAVAVYAGKQWSVGTHIKESYDLMELGSTKATHVYIVGHELLAPTPGVSLFLGGIEVQPGLTGVLKHVNAPPGNFNITLGAAVGNGIPQVGGSHFSWLIGGGVKYQLTSNLTWQTLEANYSRFGTQGIASLSTGLQFFFTRSQ